MKAQSYVLVVVFTLFNLSCGFHSQATTSKNGEVVIEKNTSKVNRLTIPEARFKARYAYFDEDEYLGDYEVQYSESFLYNNILAFAAITVLDGKRYTRVYRSRDYAFIGLIVGKELEKRADPYQVMFASADTEHRYIWVDYARNHRVAVIQNLGALQFGIIDIASKQYISITQDIQFTAHSQNWQQRNIWLKELGIVYRLEITHSNSKESHILIDFERH